MEKTKKPKAREKVRTVPKYRWVRDVRADGNLFCLEACLKHLGNLCVRFKGTLSV